MTGVEGFTPISLAEERRGTYRDRDAAPAAAQGTDPTRRVPRLRDKGSQPAVRLQVREEACLTASEEDTMWEGVRAVRTANTRQPEPQTTDEQKLPYQVLRRFALGREV
ncbi:PREDICTED: uncharacterized protein LOC106818083 [Priapulus caudatus]|uniref:Uncharacterized protein LOC106818083 n=1 Tax=Priapulus caudatus TaxID=37621 RepID=A0ABM1F1G7_PRICU|nr:PREDICTED: uncharacterized protein LOC106818083 [Priapulus caudatus]